jgi:hypothetical protein
MRQGAPSNIGVYIEYSMAVVVLFAIYNVFAFFYSAGYLPPPFFDQSLDTFMDWYNTVYWGYRPGTYDEWYSVYPPFAFLFMKLFSTPACYDVSSVIARDCDPLGAWTITGFTIINAFLLYFDYRKSDVRTALPRTVALGLGLPALFAWERGNVIVPCFTFFILAHGRTLHKTWLRWLCFGIMVNLKPYLLIVIIGRIIRRYWRWVEGCGVACVLIYVASYMIFGKGSPLEIISDTITFSGIPNVISLDFIEYSTTYGAILDILKSQLPLMHFIGSGPMEFVELTAPWAMKAGLWGVLACYAAAIWRPSAFSNHRLAALTMVLLLTISRGAGGYAELFLFYLVFLEKPKSVGQIIALSVAYILCIPWDYMLVRIVHTITDSYLSGRTVGYDFGVTLGAVARPGLLLVMEYALVAASLMDVYRSLKRDHLVGGEAPRGYAPAATAWLD